MVKILAVTNSHRYNHDTFDLKVFYTIQFNC